MPQPSCAKFHNKDRVGAGRRLGGCQRRGDEARRANLFILTCMFIGCLQGPRARTRTCTSGNTNHPVVDVSPLMLLVQAPRCRRVPHILMRCSPGLIGRQMIDGWFTFARTLIMAFPLKSSLEAFQLTSHPNNLSSA